jgi:hypothetical protein
MRATVGRCRFLRTAVVSLAAAELAVIGSQVG